MIKTKVVKRTRNLSEQLYYPELAKGLVVTMNHFFRNVFGREYTVTQEYPEQVVPYPPKARWRHVLTVRKDGQVACVACMCCPTACPANCIHIEAGEHEDHHIEKYPKVFTIDLLRCVYCGLCEEACPRDAIRMTGAEHIPPATDRRHHWVDKEWLMDKGRHITTFPESGER